MSGIEKITEKINSDARAYEQVSLEEAKKQVDFILDDYKSKADYTVAVITDKSKKTAESIVQRANSSAELIKRNGVLAMKSSIVDDVFNNAVDRIINGDEKRYFDFMTSVLLKAMEDGQGIIVMNEQDRKQYGKKFIDTINKILKKMNSKNTFVLSDETAGIKGGFILKYGNIDTNCSIESIVAEIKPELEESTLKTLFDIKK